MQFIKFNTLVAFLTIFSIAVFAAGETEGNASGDLAKKLANPIANLISVPLQYNYDENIGAGKEGSKAEHPAGYPLWFKRDRKPVRAFSIIDD